MARGRILVVDDEQDFLELRRYNLSRERYQLNNGQVFNEEQSMYKFDEYAIKRISSASKECVQYERLLNSNDDVEVER